MFLPKESFLNIIDLTPLVSIDLIIQNPQGEYLLGQRLNEPAKGSWFVPGGRIFKNEKIEDAFIRLVHNELGLDASFSDARFQGVYQHLYSNSVFSEEISTHYVVLAYKLEGVGEIDLDLPRGEQHGAYRWFSGEDILDTDDVHRYTKNYFHKRP